jgi:hypothetical protein
VRRNAENRVRFLHRYRVFNKESASGSLQKIFERFQKPVGNDRFETPVVLDKHRQRRSAPSHDSKSLTGGIMGIEVFDTLTGYP